MHEFCMLYLPVLLVNIRPPYVYLSYHIKLIDLNKTFDLQRRLGMPFFKFHKRFDICNTYCEKSHPGLRQLNCLMDRQGAPVRDGGHSRNDSRLAPSFPRHCSVFSPNGSGEFPYLWVQEELSISNRAPKMRHSVLLNSWDSIWWPCLQSL